MSFPFFYFTDPTFCFSTIGTMLICAISALLGVFSFVKKETLLGEAISHASYPGVVLGVFFSFLLQGENFFWGMFIGAFVFSLLGIFLFHKMTQKWKISKDAALCFILSSFFGTGLLLISGLQNISPSLYRYIQFCLYGQITTMTDFHLKIYAVFLGSLALFIFIFFPLLKALHFDSFFAKHLSKKTSFLEVFLFFFFVAAFVIGMRSVGILLVSAMFIAPASAARRYTHHLSNMLFLSVAFSLLSGFFGIFISVEFGTCFFPPGAVIVLVSILFAIFSFLFAPYGIVYSLFKVFHMRTLLIQEHILQKLSEKLSLSFQELKKNVPSSFLLFFVLFKMRFYGEIYKEKENFFLSKECKRSIS